ncbi:hypothetical protein [Haloferax sp. DFSO52]|uniref:DUF7351 domain-containing protein n=1 Tax=Haloferax sp. DFSO52 TaxID=3388505 RepID=UPI003A83F065
MDSSTKLDVGESDAATRKKAFQLLSDETRLELLQALWEDHDPQNASPTRFTELRERVSADDPGGIYYHLDKLTTHFVRRTEEGYELREAGKRVVRMLLSGTAIDNPEIESVEVDISCWYCGGQPEWSYREGWRYLECTNCDARCVDTVPPGVISKSEFPPSGLQDRKPNEINHADRIWSTHRRASVIDGVCPDCAGEMPVNAIHICEDHHPDWDEYQFCETCGSIFWMLTSHVCESCKYRWRMPTLFYPTRQPAVIAFYYEHGIEFDLATAEQRTYLLDYEEELLSEDPLRIRISIPLADEKLRLTYDERMDVVDLTRQGRDH